MIVLAALILALLNAHAIRGWSYQLPPSAASARIVTAAEAWHDRLDRYRPQPPVRGDARLVASARDRRFEGQASSGASASRSARANSSSAAG